MVYDFAAVDVWGRVVARAALGALGWSPGDRITMARRAGLIVVTADPVGDKTVTRQGHLRLPVGLRDWCALHGGARVFVVADLSWQRLVIHPLAALDVVVAELHDRVVDGDR